MFTRHSGLVVSSYEAKIHDKTANSFSLYGHTINVRPSISPLVFIADALSPTLDTNLDDVEDLFQHDPRFWQQPWIWMHYYIHDQGGGSFGRGFVLYLRTMAWKMSLLIKMTLGYWDEDTIENLQIKFKSNRLDIDVSDADEKHEDMLSAVGEAHSLIWLFLPNCSFLTKAGEAFNMSHAFVKDTAISASVAEAKLRHRSFLLQRVPEGEWTTEMKRWMYETRDVEEEERIEREAAIALAEEEAAAEEAEQRVLALESRGLNVEVVDDDDSIISMVTTKGVFLPTGWFSTYVQEKNRKNSYPF